MRNPRWLALAALCALPAASHAQVGRGDTLLARGDTTGAIAAYESAVIQNAADAEAHYRAGVLYLARFVADEARAGQARGQAEAHFRAARQSKPDSAKYWLALAEVLRTKGDVFSRSQVPGLVDSAVTLARKRGSSHTADIEYRAGMIWWERYEQVAHRYTFIGDATTFDATQGISDWNYLEGFLERSAKADSSDPGAAMREHAESHLRAALSANPKHVTSAGLLVTLLCNRNRWEEAEEVGRRLVRAVPDSGRAWAVYGLALTRRNQWAHAQGAFDTALTRMTPREAAPYFSLEPILKLSDGGRWKTMSPAQRSQLYSSYWAVTQPLFLTTLDQPRTEFYARLTEVLHRWSDPLRGYQGYESDRGRIYLRYGPPNVWATLGRGRMSQQQILPNGQQVDDPLGSLESERNTVLWVYTDSQLRFLFSLTPGFARATLSADFPQYYREAQNLMPVRFDNVPAVHFLDTILVQLAQFRGDAVRTDLAIYSFTPLGRMVMRTAAVEMPFQAAAIVKDGLLRDVLRNNQDGTVRGGDSLQIEHRAWRLSLKPAEYYLRVENWLPSLDRGARSSTALGIRLYGTDSLMLSDVVVAENVSPKDSTPTRWTDFFVQPSAGRLLPGAPVALLWEIYNLVPDSTGAAKYHVDLRIDVKEIERRGFTAKILGGIRDAIGLSAKGDDQVSLSYDRRVTARPGGTQVDYLKVDLQNAPEATYGITLTVTDMVSHRVVQKLRQVMVTKFALTR